MTADKGFGRTHRINISTTEEFHNAFPYLHVNYCLKANTLQVNIRHFGILDWNSGVGSGEGDY